MLVVPSLDEGFGMPVLEAMTIGVPVVAANRGALPEVSGDAAQLVDPLDDEGMAEAMRRILDDPAATQAAVERGFRRARQYSWRASAETLLAGVSSGSRAPKDHGVNRPLRIGVDARELLGDSTGVGRYLGELLTRWTSRDDAEHRRFVLYAPERLTLHFRPARPRPASSAAAAAPGGNRRISDALFETTHWTCSSRRPTPRRWDGLPLALTIHDISFVAHPEWFRAGEGLRRRWLTRRGASMASVIFTDSEFSRSELERYLRVDPGRIQVIPPGTTAPRPSAKGPEPRREPLVLFVGSLFNRRRLPDLIAAFARATTAAPAGAAGDRRRQSHLAASGSARHRRGRKASRREPSFCSYIPEDALASLYARASVFAFFSEYEGFGLTPLEAMSAGVPPVVLDTPGGARGLRRMPPSTSGRATSRGGRARSERLLTDPGAAQAACSSAPRPFWPVTPGRSGGADAVASGEDRGEMTLSIVIVSYNARDHLENCLASLAATPPAMPHDIIVVDNASTDDSVRGDASTLARGQAHRAAAERRLRQANNAGIRASRGNLILLAQQRHRSCPPGRSTGSCERLHRPFRQPRSPARGWSTRAGRAELSFGPMISPLGELRQKADDGAVRAAGWPGRGLGRASHAAASSSWTGSAAPACWCTGATPKRSGCSTSATSSTPRTWTSAPRCARGAAGSCSRRPPQITHLRGRSRATAPAAMNAAYRRSQLAFYEKHHPRLGAGCCALYLRPERAPDVTGGQTGLPLTYRCRNVRIAIDARKLRDYGIGTYIRNLLRHLARLDHDDRVRPALPRRRTATCRRRSATNFRAVAETRAGTTRSREQFRIPLDAAARARRPVPRAALRAAAARRRAGRSSRSTTAST